MLFVPFENLVPFDENAGLSLSISNQFSITLRTLDKRIMSRVEANES